MHLNLFNKIFLFLSLLSCTLLGVDEDILSQTKQNILKYSYQKAKEDSKKLKKDWIQPFYYKYIYNKGEKYSTKKSFISISQPIFKSGGIYYAIKYANSTNKFSKLSIDTQKKELIKQTLKLLFQIKQTDIAIQKQKLLIQNGEFDIKQKKEQVLNGLLSTSFLDNAILNTNSYKNKLIDLEYQKQTLINNLSQFTDKNYKELPLPTLSLIDNNQYIKNNIYLQQAQQDIKKSYLFKNITTAKYLPTINLTADYTKYHDTDNNPALTTHGTHNIGLNITIPFDTRFLNDIQSSKIEYLKKQATLQDTQKKEQILFDNAMAKIKMLDKKIQLTKEDIKLYETLVNQMQEQFDVGMKTALDVQTMQNSKEIKKLESQSLQIDKQLELLEIYTRVYHE